MNERNEAILMLEDGKCFQGTSFGAIGEAFGEVVFNTSMTGYQEILTDPSYAGQLVCMTYPLIGNYGVNDIDNESDRPWARGFIVREASRIASNWRATGSLDDYLARHNIVAIENIDTRALVRHIREKGTMRAVISTSDFEQENLLKKILKTPEMENQELASTVSTKTIYEFENNETETYHVVCFDFGVKSNSLRNLAKLGCKITVVPSTTKAIEILAFNPDGIFLSNGPGDPASMHEVIDEVRKLVESEKPIFGICLGHQLIGRTFGGETYKLRFGHRGGNQPIKNLSNGRIEITAHNHGFAIDAESLPNEIEVTHINLNDNTVAGIGHLDKPIFSVQYHPEAAPGPHDAHYHFLDFIELMKTRKGANFAVN